MTFKQLVINHIVCLLYFESQLMELQVDVLGKWVESCHQDIAVRRM